MAADCAILIVDKEFFGSIECEMVNILTGFMLEILISLTLPFSFLGAFFSVPNAFIIFPAQK